MDDILENRKAGDCADDLAKKHEELSRVFRLVELAKREWEKTMDCVGDMVLLVDSNNRIKRCNKAFMQFTGRPYDKVLGWDWAALLTAYGIEASKLVGKDRELFHRKSNRWFTVNTYAVKGISSDETSSLVITFHDSTALKEVTGQLEQSNREMEENRNELRQALDELSSLIQRVEKEKKFDVRFSNQNLVKCWRIKDCAMTGCPCHGRDAERCWQAVGTHCGGEIQGTFVKKYGRCIECDVFKESAPNPILQIGEHFNNMMHILELKNKELEGAYVELKATQAKIVQQEKLASIGQIAAGVAHEVNNPIGFVSSNLGALGKYLERITDFIQTQTAALQSPADPDALTAVAEKRARLKVDFIPGDVRKLIAESLDGTDRVRTIVQDLKNFSRVDKGERQYANINECLETTLTIIWNELKYKAAVKKDYGELPPVKCHPQQLDQVFMNLLVNAVHAIEDWGEIAIRTWKENGSVLVSVSDTGCGIPREIFEPFFTTKEAGKGTGLGLSIVYDIIKKHHGEFLRGAKWERARHSP